MMIRAANPCFEGSIEELFLFMAHLHHTGHLHICLCDSCMWTRGTYLSKKKNISSSPSNLKAEAKVSGSMLPLRILTSHSSQPLIHVILRSRINFLQHMVQIKANHPPWQSSINLLWITKLKAVESRLVQGNMKHCFPPISNPKWKRLAE